MLFHFTKGDATLVHNPGSHFCSKLKVWNIGIEDMEYVLVLNLKMPSGMKVIVKDV